MTKQNRLIAFGIAVAAIAVGAFSLGLIPAPVAGLLFSTLALGAISFNTIPSSLRVPFFAVEFDNSKATQGPAVLSYRALIIGQKLSAGTGTANTLYKLTSVNDAITLGGRGSGLHRQALRWFQNNTFTEVWAGILSDNGAGVAATGTVTITGPATAAGTISLYLGGTLVSLAVASGDVQNTIATNLAAAITLNADLPVTANAATNVVTITHRHKGAWTTDFDMRTNYLSTEKTPAGLTVALSGQTLSGGTTNPVLTTLITALADNWYQIWSHPYTDATSLTAIETELLSRFGPMRMIDGVAFTSALGTQGTLGTLGLTRNSQFSVIMSQPGKNPLIPPMEFAAATAASIAYYGSIDPSRPFQTLPLVGMLPPAEADYFTLTERGLNLVDGIGTSKVAAGGVVQIERPITTYRLNAASAPDTSYLDTTTMLTLMYLRYSFRTLMLNTFPRHKLADDGTRFGAGQAVITPKIGKATACVWFRQMEDLGLVENFNQFKNDLVVERDGTDATRLNFLLPPDLINQLIVGAAQIQFRI